jgi:hypothetical protein
MKKMQPEDNGPAAQLCVTPDEWYSLPVDLRNCYWEETEFGAKPPNERLKMFLQGVLCAGTRWQ